VNPLAGRLRIVTSPDCDPLKTRVFEAATGVEIYVSRVEIDINYRARLPCAIVRIEAHRPLIEAATEQDGAAFARAVVAELDERIRNGGTLPTLGIDPAGVIADVKLGGSGE
jgi:hypothetical protein